MTLSIKLMPLFIFLLFSGFSQAVEQLTVKVARNMTCNDGSIMGSLYLNDEFIGRTLELPFRNNETGISSIPAGSYVTSMRSDGGRGWRIQLENVPGREYIQLHVGNFQNEIEGCILLGAELGNDQCMVTESHKAVELLRERISAKAEKGNMTSIVDITFEVTE